LPIFKTRKIPLSSIVRFSSEDQPFDLVDITTDTSNASKNFSDFLSSPGEFVYETRFSVNENEARRQMITDIKFEFFAGRPSANSTPLKSCNFAIKIGDPKRGNDRDPENYQKIAIFNQAEGFQNVLRESVPIKLISIEQQENPTTYRLAAKDSETVNKEDPAKSISSGKILGATPGNAMSYGLQKNVPMSMTTNFEKVGSKSSNGSSSIAQLKSNLGKKDSTKGNLANSLLQLQTIKSPQQLVRSQPVVLAELVTADVEYTRHLSFDKKDLLGFNKLYVKVSGITKTSVTARITPKIYTIAHIAEVKDFFGNAEPPVVKKLESSFGKASFLVTRVDPTLRRVAVIRITKNPNLTKSFFENVSTLEFGDNDTVLFEQSVDNVAPNTIIYRFIVQNEDGSYGGFTSSILDSYTKVVDQKKVLSSTTPISIRAINTVDGIQVSVDTVNDQVYSLRLLRQDLGAIGEFSQTVTTILDQNGRSTQKILGEITTLNYLDRDVVSGRHYRYFAAYRIGSISSISICQETISDEDETIVRLKPSNRLPFSANVTPATSFQDSDNSTVIQFDLQVSEVEEQYNVLIDALQQAGVGQQFITDLQNDRQKARQVAAFLIERVDRISGRRTSFGIFAPGKFTDSPELRRRLKITDPLPGRKYEYVCKLCIRPPSTFLLSALTGFIATDDPTKDITQVLAAKFQNALVGRGILPSEKQMRDGNSIRENFLLGQTGLEITTTVTLPQFSPRVDDVTVRKKKFYNILTWKALGDLSQVSYFLVYCNYNGNAELLGSVSSIGKSAIYQFRDTRFHNEVGQKNYFVKIVTVDHEIVTASPQIQTITNFSMPAPAINGVVLLPSRYEIKGNVIPTGQGAPLAVDAGGGVGDGGGGGSGKKWTNPLAKLDVDPLSIWSKYTGTQKNVPDASMFSDMKKEIEEKTSGIAEKTLVLPKDILTGLQQSALPGFGLQDPAPDSKNDMFTKMQGISAKEGIQNQTNFSSQQNAFQAKNDAASNSATSQQNVPQFNQQFKQSF